ncbi:hypothetical protein Kisp02_56810 [Kineosporia sp. NBRC 101731]|nr:hypothetical protein [Kineosporia sp. NBRC 101731]GLY32316.1 hypothetical protein Kisp02_56810 [Kineosporia sp. NBRC 101731]
MQERDQPLEVPFAGGREKGIDDFTAMPGRSLGGRYSLGPVRPYASPGPAGQLASGGGGAVEQGADVIEGNTEQVVQDEGQIHDSQRQLVAHRTPSVGCGVCSLGGFGIPAGR